MKLITLGILIVLIGMLVVIAGMFSMAYQAWKFSECASESGSGEGGGEEQPKPAVRGGGVIMIGPIPIIFGSDTGAMKVAVILAIVLMLLAFVLFYLLPGRLV